MDIPRTRYAAAADGAHIAYQVIGSGPEDLIYVPGWSSSLELSWELPLDARFLRALASTTRLILIDRRGRGFSDSVFAEKPPSLDQLMDDITVVLDAAGSERAAIFGVFEGGPMCTLFAATYPARTRALVLYGTYARGAWAPDYPWAWTDEELEQEIAQAEQGSRGEGEEDHFEAWRHEMVPSLVDDDTLQPFFLKLYSGNLGSSIALVRLEHEVDIRAVLPTIRVPTLVINRTEGSGRRSVGGALARRADPRRSVRRAARRRPSSVGGRPGCGPRRHP